MQSAGAGGAVHLLPSTESISNSPGTRWLRTRRSSPARGVRGCRGSAVDPRRPGRVRPDRRVQGRARRRARQPPVHSKAGRLRASVASFPPAPAHGRERQEAKPRSILAGLSRGVGGVRVGRGSGTRTRTTSPSFLVARPIGSHDDRRDAWPRGRGLVLSRPSIAPQRSVGGSLCGDARAIGWLSISCPATMRSARGSTIGELVGRPISDARKTVGVGDADGLRPIGQRGCRGGDAT